MRELGPVAVHRRFRWLRAKEMLMLGRFLARFALEALIARRGVAAIHRSLGVLLLPIVFKRA
jgi:hypothetical protein